MSTLFQTNVTYLNTFFRPKNITLIRFFQAEGLDFGEVVFGEVGNVLAEFG